MLRNKAIDRLCCAALALMLALTALIWAGKSSAGRREAIEMGYEGLFDQSVVHTVDISIADWDGFLAEATDELYAACSVTVDGEKISNVGIRAKGNTSLSSVSSTGTEKYSLKIEFDHYEDGLTYHGLDKLSLNNLICDATMMKDYLAYTLMSRAGVPSPLCSYVSVTVNGEPWGLYLAVEGVEDSFLQRNNMTTGELYKPDSSSFGGGRGYGRDFDLERFRVTEGEDGAEKRYGEDFAFGGGVFNFGRGDRDVKLQYIDDEFDSYLNIFDNAKTDIGKKAKTRLIDALQTLSGENAEDAVLADEVISYLAVHDFLQNDDSYTGVMVHNYYLYEEDGRLAIIPWDYNLSFGGMGGADASATVNSPIDSPVSGDLSDRPLVAWIFEDEDALARYHEVYSQFIAENVESGWISGEIDRVAAMLRAFVEEDPNGFYTADEFDDAVAALQTCVSLRGESVRGQLDGTIPATEEGQRADGAALIDTGELDLTVMGYMSAGGRGGDGFRDRIRGGTRPDRGGGEAAAGAGAAEEAETLSEEVLPDSGRVPFGGPPPEGGLPDDPAGGAGPSGTHWLVFGGCLALLLAALAAAAKVRGHNE